MKICSLISRLPGGLYALIAWGLFGIFDLTVLEIQGYQETRRVILAVVMILCGVCICKAKQMEHSTQQRWYHNLTMLYMVGVITLATLVAHIIIPEVAEIFHGFDVVILILVVTVLVILT